MGGGLINLELY